MASAATEVQLREETGKWVLPLVGREVDQVCFDHAVTLVVEGSETVRLATPFTVAVDGTVHSIDPEQPETVVLALRLFGAVVLAAEAGQDGTLELRFDGDRVLRSEPHPDYEAWELNGGLPPVSSTYHLQAQPGGGVSVV
jgi:hypothetical protein